MHLSVSHIHIYFIVLCTIIAYNNKLSYTTGLQKILNQMSSDWSYLEVITPFSLPSSQVVFDLSHRENFEWVSQQAYNIETIIVRQNQSQNDCIYLCILLEIIG